MAILPKGCNSDNFEPHNSLKRCFTNIQSFSSNVVACEFFLESNSPDILALCGPNLDDSIDTITHIHGLAVYVKKGTSFCMQLISTKICGF